LDRQLRNGHLKDEWVLRDALDAAGRRIKIKVNTRTKEVVDVH
jgi:hypothetical protein